MGSSLRLVLGSLAIFSFISCTQIRTKPFPSEFESQGQKILQGRRPASLKEDVNQLDQRKPTVCAITLNSSEEKEIFNKYLSRDFNFIELANREGNQDEWFMNACRSGVRCDVLLVSGHFAGTFFGSSGLALPLEKLEGLACQTQCDGILKHPKEVFLFGCNTLAGKKKDHRTQAEYVQVLIHDGFGRGDAERIAAFRYSPLGQTNESRMRRSFKGAQKLYGFDAVAPSGVNIQGSLQNYLKKVGNYRQHLEKLNPKVKNDVLAKTLTWAPFVEAEGWGDVSQSPTCYLNSPQVDATDKVRWIRDTLANPTQGIQNSVFIHQYLEAMEEKGVTWTEPQQKIFAEIKGFSKVQKSLEDIIEREVRGMLNVQASVASLMRLLSWWDQEKYGLWANRLIGSLIRNDISREQIDDLCSSGLRLDFMPTNLPANSLSWNPSVLEAIRCLRPSHLGLVNELLNIAKNHSNPESRVTALRGLQSAVRFNTNIHSELTGIIETENTPSVLDQAGNTLREALNVDQSIVLRLVETIRKPQLFLRASAAAEALKVFKPNDPAIHQSLFQVLASNSPEIHMVAKIKAGEVLAEIHPNHPQLTRELITLIDQSPDFEIKFTAAGVLSKITNLSMEHQEQLASLVGSGADYNSRIGAMLALSNSKPFSPSIRQKLEAALAQEKDSFVIKKIEENLKIK